MNIKEIITDAVEYFGQKTSSNYATSTKTDDRKLFAMANASIVDILNRHTWSLLKKKATVTIVAGQSLYDLPDDYHRMIDDTMYINDWKIDMPASDKDLANNWRTLGEEKARVIGGQLEFTDVPTGTVTYFYMSKNQVQASAGGEKARFTRDDDIYLLDSELLTRFIRYRYALQIDDSSAGAFAQELQGYLRDAIGNDKSAKSFVSNCYDDDYQILIEPRIYGTSRL